MKRQITAQEAFSGHKGQITARQAFGAMHMEDQTKVLHSCSHWHTYKGYKRQAEVAELETHVCPKCAK